MRIPKLFLLVLLITAVVLVCLWGANVFNNNPPNEEQKVMASIDSRNAAFKHLKPLFDATDKGLLDSSYMQIPGGIQNFVRYQDQVARQYYDEDRVSIVNLTDEIFAPSADGNPEVVPIYINMSKHQTRNSQIQEELKAFGLNGAFRLEGVERPGNGAQGCYLSHMHCLGWGHVKYPNSHLLILEDDFQFCVTGSEFAEKLNIVDRICHQRWDVLVLGQFVHEWQPLSRDDELLRLFKTVTTSGYLVHRDYVLDLLTKWHQAYLPREHLDHFQHYDNLDQIQVAFQKVDLWLGFKVPLGQQRPGESTIGMGHADNRWQSTPSLQRWSHGDSGVTHDLILRPDWQPKQVGVCFVATGKYLQYVPRVVQSCIRRLLKPHPLSFFVFTDAPDDLNDEMFAPCQYRTYSVERQGFPGDTLYRYHYMLQAEAELQKLDHVFYMDVDYWVCNVPEEKLLLSDGLVGVANMHDFYRRDGDVHSGTPDNQPNSTAYIAPGQRMDHYYCGGFQGGSSAAFLQACRDIKANIDQDDQNQVMALWHDESHWNRYLLDHKPSAVLSQSYVFPEQCLNVECAESNCVQIREHHIGPVMVALQKDHEKVRN